MKKIYLLFLFSFISIIGHSQKVQHTLTLQNCIKPFYHGVASGDPLPDRVIIWTRVTPEDSANSVSVLWEVAEDKDFVSIYKSDSVTTTPARDYTVKVDVDALKPDQVYYYRCKSSGGTSIPGGTKTTPVNAKD